MIVAVLDTNVLASGLVRPHSTPGAVLRAWQDSAFSAVVSEHILGELEATLQDPYFRARLTDQQIAEDLSLLRSEARVVAPTEEVRGVATHPEDDLILSVAISIDADYLVTGDRKLLALGSLAQVNIVTPRDFLDVLGLDDDARSSPPVTSPPSTTL
ncbi:MAG: putative toxin-antitoxin system toxin component, PIN family [Thermomicrobiales bacterium]